MLQNKLGESAFVLATSVTKLENDNKMVNKGNLQEQIFSFSRRSKIIRLAAKKFSHIRYYFHICEIKYISQIFLNIMYFTKTFHTQTYVRPTTRHVTWPSW